MGFVLNPYDLCVVNNVIDGKQCTVAWYVDHDLKVSHMKRSVVTDILNTIESKFGTLKITHGRQHTYLGMDITFKQNGTVEIRMKNFIKEAIEASLEDVSNGVSTPAQRTLFDIDEDSESLGQKKSELYHHIIAKLLYVSTRC